MVVEVAVVYHFNIFILASSLYMYSPCDNLLFILASYIMLFSSFSSFTILDPSFGGVIFLGVFHISELFHSISEDLRPGCKYAMPYQFWQNCVVLLCT